MHYEIARYKEPRDSFRRTSTTPTTTAATISTTITTTGEKGPDVRRSPKLRGGGPRAEGRGAVAAVKGQVHFSSWAASSTHSGSYAFFLLQKSNSERPSPAPRPRRSPRRRTAHRTAPRRRRSPSHCAAAGATAWTFVQQSFPLSSFF